MKKLLKRGVAFILSCMLLLQYAPLENVHAATKVWENTDENVQQDNEIAITYAALENSVVATSETQKVILGYQGDMKIASATLVLEDETTEILRSVEATSVNDGMLFEIKHEETSLTSMLLQSVSVTDTEGNEHEIEFASIGMEVRYGVNQVVTTNPDAVLDDGSIDKSDVDVNVATVDGDNESSLDKIQQSLEDANKDTLGTSQPPKARMLKNDLVIVLDPGHDSKHAGAQGNGLREESLNLKIAQYCKAELEQYNGVTVYMTRNSMDCPHPEAATAGEDNTARVAYAKSVGANAYVSIHLNSNPKAAPCGVEVYYPNDHYLSSVGAVGGELAQSVLDNLVALGIANRGTLVRDSEYEKDGTIDTYEDGSVSDYYGVIRNSKKAGIPGIIVEHAFISNPSDAANYLSSEESLQRLGIADATGIANYYKLSKGKAIRIRDLSITEGNTDVTIETNYSAKNTNNKYRFLYREVGEGDDAWKLISEWTTSDKVTWKPELKDYEIQAIALSEDGALANHIQRYTPSVDYTKDFLLIKGINVQQNEKNVTLQADYISNASSVEYRWLQYDVVAGVWTTISDWSDSSSINWRPANKTYWIRLEMSSSAGLSDNKKIGQAFTTDYSSTSINYKGVCWQYQKRGIDLGVAYTSFETDNEFKWMAYNLDTKKWSVIADWNSGNWATWKPEKGNYWVDVQGRNSEGGSLHYTMCFAVSSDYSHETLSLNGMSWNYDTNGINVGTAYSTNADSVKFKWLSYNLENKKWELITDWYSGNWVTWHPHQGNYWLQVQAQTDDGTTQTQTICFAVSKNYDLQLSGICIQEQNIGTSAGVAYNSNVGPVEFQWQLYDPKKQTWTDLSEWTTENWVTFYPGTGYYWLNVNARTSAGYTSSFCIRYTVNARYLIMGDSDVNATQLVQFYQKNKWGAFPDYYQSTDAPTLEQFCQMYVDECRLEGVKPEVAFAQAMKETAYLHFDGAVSIDKNNFAGIGATNSDPNNKQIAKFDTVRDGIRAQVQHLKAYACDEPLVSTCVDPRFTYVQRGVAPYVEYLGVQENPAHKGWATDVNYGNSIVNTYIKAIFES